MQSIQEHTDASSHVVTFLTGFVYSASGGPVRIIKKAKALLPGSKDLKSLAILLPTAFRGRISCCEPGTRIPLSGGHSFPGPTAAYRRNRRSGAALNNLAAAHDRIVKVR
jgi:hypothetical protein